MKWIWFTFINSSNYFFSENCNKKTQSSTKTSQADTSKKEESKPAKTKCIGDVDSDDEKDANQVNFFAEQIKRQIKGKWATVYVAKVLHFLQIFYYLCFIVYYQLISNYKCKLKPK